MTEAKLNAIADELAIRRVLDEYCLRLELNSFEDWLKLFTDESIYEVYGLVLAGQREISDLLSKAPHGTHIGGPVRVIIDGDIAHTIQSYIFVSTSSDEWNTGWYDRQLVRTADGWKIAHTKVKIGRKDALPVNERAKKTAYPIEFV
jgi:hypothetical protein